MDDERPDFIPRRSWGLKFARAFRGIAAGFRSQSSFVVHLPVAVATLGVASWLRLDRVSYAVILLCVGAVLSAELFNTAIEILARRIDRKENREIGDALDIASGAVLGVVLAAVAIGLLILGPPLWARCFG